MFREKEYSQHLNIKNKKGDTMMSIRIGSARLCSLDDRSSELTYFLLVDELECGGAFPLDTVRDSVLEHLAAELERWRMDGFTALWPKIAAMDFLKGRTVAIARTDDDASPATGECGGICRDGALLVNGEPVYAGSALWYNPRVF